MKLRHVEVFYAVYTSGSTTAAAGMLNVSQPSVSKVLAHAEQQLGFALFERSRGRLIATPEADRLFRHVADVYEDVDRLRHVARNLRIASSGRLRVASTPALGVELLPTAVASFRDTHPDIVFELETLHFDEISKALIESRIDIGIAFDAVPQPGIERQTLAQSRFVVIAPGDADFRDRTRVTVADLQAFPFIGLNGRGPLGRLLSNYLSGAGVDLDVVTWTETYHVARALVAAGTGIAITDEITARAASGGDVHILELEPRIDFDIQALHLTSAPMSIAANSFVEHLKRSIDDFLTRNTL